MQHMLLPTCKRGARCGIEWEAILGRCHMYGCTKNILADQTNRIPCTRLFPGWQNKKKGLRGRTRTGMASQKADEVKEEGVGEGREGLRGKTRV